MATNTDNLLAKIGITVEFAAFVGCLIRYIWLQFYAPAKIFLLSPAQPWLLGAFASMAYVIGSYVLFRKGKFRASAALAGAMVVVLLALRYATL